MTTDVPTIAVQHDRFSPAGRNRRWVSRYLEQQNVEQEDMWFKPNLMLPEDLTVTWSNDSHTVPAAGATQEVRSHVIPAYASQH